MRVAIKLILIFALVFAGVKVWYGRLEDALRRVPVIREAVVERTPEKATEVLRKAVDYTIIVRRNIFQAVEKSGKVAKDEQLAPTKLKLTLMGTVFGTKRDARAIIIDEKKKQNIYKIGDSIQGALIKNIERGKVVLRVNGRSEALLIKDRQGGSPDIGRQSSRFRTSVPRKSLRQRLTRTPIVRPRRRTSYPVTSPVPSGQNDELEQEIRKIEASRRRLPDGHPSPDPDPDKIPAE